MCSIKEITVAQRTDQLLPDFLIKTRILCFAAPRIQECVFFSLQQVIAKKASEEERNFWHFISKSCRCDSVCRRHLVFRNRVSDRKRLNQLRQGLKSQGTPSPVITLRPEKSQTLIKKRTHFFAPSQCESHL